MYVVISKMDLLKIIVVFYVEDYVLALRNSYRSKLNLQRDKTV